MILEAIGAIVIAIAITVGFSAHYISKKNDTAAEQIAEAVLHTRGIDIDFSADDKKADEQNKADESKN